MKSIICRQEEKYCRVCGVKNNLHLHHIFFGKNRKKADEDGLTIWLCYEHHEGTYGVHGKMGHKLDIELKQKAQKSWMIVNNKKEEDFRKRYGKNYLI